MGVTRICAVEEYCGTGISLLQSRREGEVVQCWNFGLTSVGGAASSLSVCVCARGLFAFARTMEIKCVPTWSSVGAAEGDLPCVTSAHVR